MAKEQKLAERIDDQIRALVADRDAARREHAGLALKLVESPGNANLQKQLEALYQEIAGYGRKIADLEAAKAEAARRDTSEAKRAEFGRLKTLYGQIVERMGRQAELAGHLVKIADSFAPALAEYESLAQDNWADVRAVVRGASGGNSDAVERHYMPLENPARGVAGRAALINALWASGLGRVGMHLDPWVEVSACDDGKRSAAESMASAADKVRTKLAQLIEQREAEVLK